jgi:hypothetical protein
MTLFIDRNKNIIKPMKKSTAAWVYLLKPKKSDDDA